MCCDRRPPVFEAAADPRVSYVQADLADAGDAYAVVRGHDAVIHAAAIPDPTRNPPHRVFRNNLMATFNVIEAAVRFGWDRWLGERSAFVGMHDFGASGPIETVYPHFGFTAENVAKTARSLL